MRHLRSMLHVLKKCLVVGAGSYMLKTIMTNWEKVINSSCGKHDFAITFAKSQDKRSDFNYLNFKKNSHE